jgi:hypothetical protein
MKQKKEDKKLSSEQLILLTKSRIDLKDHEYDWYENDDDFIRFCFVAKTPQSYGTAIQERLATKNSFKTVKSSEERGDVIENGEYKEIKASISAKGSFRAVQIRPHHNYTSCILAFFHILEDGTIEKHFFEVPEKDTMSIPGISLAHGTKKNKHKNSQLEYAATFDIPSDKNKKKFTQPEIAWNYIQKFAVTRNF